MGLTGLTGLTGLSGIAGTVTEESILTYYIAGDGTGDDGAAGTIGAPWATLSKITNYAGSLPVAFALKKGGSRWHEGIVLPSSGAAGAPCKITAYGTGANPIIDGTDEVTSWSLVSGTPGTDAIYSATWNNHGNPRSTAEQVFEDNSGVVTRYYYGTSASLDRPASFFVDIATHTLYVRCTDHGSPATAGRTIRCARTNSVNAMRGIVANGEEYWDVEGITFWGQPVHGFSSQTSGGGHFNFTGCTFSYQGTHGIRMYPSGGAGEVHDLVMTDCNFDHVLGEAVWSGQTGGQFLRCIAANCGLNRNQLGYGPGSTPNLQIAGVFNIGSNTDGTLVKDCTAYVDEAPLWTPVGWVLDSGSVYKITSFTQNTGPGELCYQVDSGTPTALRRDAAKPASAGGFWLDDTNDILYVWCTDSGSPAAANRWIQMTGQAHFNALFNIEWESGLTRPTNAILDGCYGYNPNGLSNMAINIAMRVSGSNNIIRNCIIRQNGAQNAIMFYNGATNSAVYFSTFYMESATGAIAVSNSSDGAIAWKNNIVVSPVVSGGRHVSMTAARFANFDADYNLWVGGQASPFRDTSDRNWAYWQGTYAKDAHGIQLVGANTAASVALVNWTVDPPTAWTMLPDSDFAGLNLGLAIAGITLDKAGATRGDPPEIGPYER